MINIEFTKRVVFKDCDGTVLKVYEVGDREVSTAKGNHYFVTSMGGIYFYEAREVSNND